MRLLICDDLKINSFNLANDAKDYFTINYYYTKDSLCETITLSSSNGLWEMKANVNMQIMDENNQKLTSIFFREYDKYRVHFSDLNIYVMMYIVPDLEQYADIEVKTTNRITIGSTSANNIIYNSKLINSSQMMLYDENGSFVIKNSNPQNKCLYINSKLTDIHILKLGDVIFIDGLKIIWMDKYFKINNPKNSINIMGLQKAVNGKVKTTNYTPASEMERNIKLFSENQVFFHTPRLQSKIKEEEVVIDAPPDAERTERMPIVLTLGSSAIIGIISCMTGISAVQGLVTGTADLFNVILQLIMSLLMLISCILFPILTEKWDKKRSKKKEKLRQEKYRKYLQDKVNEIEKIVKNQETILHENNLTLKEIEKRIKIKSENLWCREIIDDDFLTVRLGIGNLPAKIKIEAPKEQFSIYDDDLKDEVHKIANKKREVTNVPISISMIENKITPFIINSSFKQDYINSIMLQLIYYYSGLDLKIVVLTNELNEHKWDYIKYLPHCLSNDMDKRFFAVNEDEMTQISMYLEKIYDQRLSDNDNKSNEETKNTNEVKDLYKNFSEYYLIITDDFKSVKNFSIIKRILNSNQNIGFSLMIFGDSLKNLPSRLEKFINIEENYSGIYSKQNDYQVQLTPEYSKNINLEEYSKIIGNIPVFIKNDNNSLPASLNFLDMYHAGRVDHLNILQKWRDNDPTISLNALLGVKSDGKPIGLDLHEKFHGPHGLIAGTTGSGKSEFIITYVLSMAINYSPEEVQFVLIDYKGGGLAGAFENREKGIKIPHLVGTITNLDTSEMNRTLVSINSELQRRQMKFNKARDELGEGTIDIYKYQKLYREGKVKEPISHLFIICDEFAELKQQQPEFMNELISTSRIGRSLGVHLILATQKPSGVVDDQIWSNSRFKICLKVQTVGDSNEMLKKPDAAYIKEAGRFYLQVGNDELFELGQSAWTGAKYIPVDRVLNKINDSIDFITNDGNVIKTINDEIKQSNNINLGEQLTNIVKYLYDIAVREGIKFSSLWLPNIKPEIYMKDLIEKYSFKSEKFNFEAVIGEYDKPAKQEQGLYTLSLNSRNTIIFGLPNSGKENYLTSLIYSLSIYHSPEEINFYILDFGSESLGVFKKLPHVGDFITSSEVEKVATQFDFLEKEIRKRKELFAEYSGSYKEYCKNSGHSVPLIVTVLNAYEAFLENCGDFDQQLMHLLREGSKYGIVFVMSVVSTNSIRATVQEYFPNKILLQVNDPFDYQYILGAEHGTVPSKLFGRGLTIIDNEVCEFQTSYITIRDSINDLIKSAGKNLFDYFKVKAPEIKNIPNVIKLDSLFKYSKSISRIPVGYTRDEVELYYYDFTKFNTNLIIGKDVTTKLDFMCSIIDLVDQIQNIKLNIFDFISSIKTDGNAAYYNRRFVEPFSEILTNSNQEYTVNIIIGIGNISQVLDQQEMELFNNIMNNVPKLKNQTFIIFDNIDRINKINSLSWYNNINKNTGIWVGNDIDEQEVFNINNLTNYDIEEKMKNLIYVIDNNNYKVVKGVGGKEEEDIFG